MSEPVIKVENLGKKYIIGHQKPEKYTALRDVIGNTVKSILKPNSQGDNTREEFWALKDINFEINRGDRVGIIGRNGAGKSTLLKVLSRITEPTTGQIKIRGRVASLLEVGTGFHPELTGRENIFLNGAILGMGKLEIKKKFDEIVDFAEVEKFLDTPVKRYSSGMYVRLAFAVAAYLEPEILVVDEVLAVGDAAFQKKCLGKMEDVSKEGRTVLFISHNMAVVSTLCQRAIWLVSGKVNMDGDVDSITNKYLTSGLDYSGEVILKKPAYNYRFCFKKVSILNVEGKSSSIFDVRESIKILLEYEVIKIIKNLEVGIKVLNHAGISIFTVERSLNISSQLLAGTYIAEIEIPPLFLSPGSYSISIAAHIPNIEIISIHPNIIGFEIEETGSQMAQYKGLDFGVVLANFPWKELAIN